jgi:hypothetical protein
MKALWFTVVAILFAGTLACRAQVTAYPIKLSGAVVTLDQSDITTQISIGKKWIAGDGNRLVLVVDLDNHTVELDSVDADNEYVDTLAESSRCAFMVNGVFGATLEFSALTVSNGLFSITGDGSMEVRGQLKTDADGNPTNISGHLLGVLNDSVDGDPSEPDALIRAKIRPGGRAFDATDL